jgi:hypothetical protein
LATGFVAGSAADLVTLSVVDLGSDLAAPFADLVVALLAAGLATGFVAGSAADLVTLSVVDLGSDLAAPFADLVGCVSADSAVLSRLWSRVPEVVLLLID